MSSPATTPSPVSSNQRPSMSNRDTVKSRITEMYHKSIKSNPSSLTEEHIAQLKAHLYDKFPAKVAQFNEDCVKLYSRESLKSSASSWDSLSASVPTFASPEQVAHYRELYQRVYSPHVAADNFTMLLPNGPMATNAKFGEIVNKLLAEVNDFLWALNECRIAMYLMKPPFGEEKSFDSKILATGIATVEAVYRSTRAKRASLQGAFRKRAADTIELVSRPQTEDTRHYVAHSEEQLFNDVALYAILVRNNYAIMHQFAVKNATRIEYIMKQALKDANYGKSGGV